MSEGPTRLMTPEQLQRLFDYLLADQYTVYGPVVRDQAIGFDRIGRVEDLPRGLRDEQQPGYYRLHATGEPFVLSHTTTQDSWKKFLFPQEEVLYRAQAGEGGLMFTTQNHKPVKRAFFGIRSCDLHAIAVQDRVFVSDEFADPGYAARRSDLLLIAANCTHAVDTCFCSSLDTGPKARYGFDLAVTEVLVDAAHGFLLEPGSAAGERIVADLNLPVAGQTALDEAQRAIAAAANQTRSLPTANLKEQVYAHLQNEDFWREVGERCLHCANCTLVCPTCFCSAIEERVDLGGSSHERVRYWDSCFNESHSHIAGGSVRASGDARYRQWFSHKLAFWQDQFDTLGCTGCGRCVTWCPTGIDLTAEAHRLQALSQQTEAT